MAPMAAKTGLSILIMLMGLFQDGLTKLEQKDYPGAIAVFTKVIEHKETSATLRNEAVFWRAMAYGKAGKVDEAKADLGGILGGTQDPDLRGKAFIAFKELGGDPETLLPRETPREAFEEMWKLGTDKDVAGFRRRLGGTLADRLDTVEMLSKAQGQGNVAASHQIHMLCQAANYGGSEVGQGEEFGTANVVWLVGNLALTVELVAVGDEWHSHSLLAAKKADARQTPTHQITARQIHEMKKVATALIMYANDRSTKPPDSLTEAKVYIVDERRFTFTDPATGKTSPLLYHKPERLVLSETPHGIYMVATPAPVEGVRFVACTDGKAMAVPEAEFVKTARAQGSKLTPRKPEKVDKDAVAKIETLIKQLGDPKAAIRKAAYQELVELGDQAAWILQKHKNHPDPEVRLNVREILD